ncbi:MAG TPA: pyridoxamine 5'-phosphate oxidase family protein [Acidimicrobiia bacterium]|jgi:hypothetical protein
MASWSDVVRAAPELARLVHARFQATGLGLLATVRRDGAPRISGIEPLFASGELWLGSMPEARKGADLRRDPRFALHSATTDKDVTDGDAKVSGRAVLIDDLATTERFVDAFRTETGRAPDPGTFDLFRAEVTAVSMLRPAGDHLDIDWWDEATGVHHVDRS